jgi:hypothetical protein
MEVSIYRTLYQNIDRSVSAVAEFPGGEAEEGASQRSRALKLVSNTSR